MNKNHFVNLSFQLVPINTSEAYPIIDAAIKVIQDAGVKYEVQPFSTILEGELDHLMDIVLKAKDAAFAAGGEELILNIQIHLKKNTAVHFEDKTGKFE